MCYIIHYAIGLHNIIHYIIPVDIFSSAHSHAKKTSAITEAVGGDRGVLGCNVRVAVSEDDNEVIDPPSVTSRGRQHVIVHKVQGRGCVCKSRDLER